MIRMEDVVDKVREYQATEKVKSEKILGKAVMFQSLWVVKNYQHIDEQMVKTLVQKEAGHYSPKLFLVLDGREKISPKIQNNTVPNIFFIFFVLQEFLFLKELKVFFSY